MMDIHDRIAHDDVKRAAHHAGRLAALDGQGAESCPYDAEPARAAWLKGHATITAPADG